MSDFTFNCPHCKQSLEAPEEILGQLIDCPSCKGLIQIPSPSPKLSHPPNPQLKNPPAPKPIPLPSKGIPDLKQPTLSKAVFLAVAALIALVVMLAVALGILLTRKEKTDPILVGASVSSPNRADGRAPRSAKELEEWTRRRQQEEESKRISDEASEQAEESSRLATAAAKREADKQREQKQIQDRIDKAVQLRTVEDTDKRASLLVYLAKWEADEFTKHADLKQNPIAFKASFKTNSKILEENSFGGVVLDDPSRIVGSKFDFDHNSLVMILRTDNYFQSFGIIAAEPECFARSLKKGASSGSLLFCPDARVDVTIAIPMVPDEAKEIRKKEEDGTLTVTVVFQVENYQFEKKTLRGDKRHEYLHFDVTPRVLSVSFN